VTNYLAAWTPSIHTLSSYRCGPSPYSSAPLLLLKTFVCTATLTASMAQFPQTQHVPLTTSYLLSVGYRGERLPFKKRSNRGLKECQLSKVTQHI
jgi:hypothetical protein